MQDSKINNLQNLIFATADFDALHTRQKLSVSRFAAPLVSLVSLSLLSLLFMPPRDEMLQFVDESGLINVYLLTLTFLISPVTETDLIRYEAEKDAMKHQAEFYKR